MRTPWAKIHPPRTKMHALGPFQFNSSRGKEMHKRAQKCKPLAQQAEQTAGMRKTTLPISRCNFKLPCPPSPNKQPASAAVRLALAFRWTCNIHPGYPTLRVPATSRLSAVVPRDRRKVHPGLPICAVATIRPCVCRAYVRASVRCLSRRIQRSQKSKNTVPGTRCTLLCHKMEWNAENPKLL